MTMNCVRCGQPAFAILKIEVMIGETLLKVNEETDETGVCALFMIELSDFFVERHADRRRAYAGLGNKRRRCDR
jgi:hypothetical protein